MNRLLLCFLALSSGALAQSPKNPPKTAREAAEIYLNALTGQGDESGKALLLGGVTMNAQIFTLENWKILSEDPTQKEAGELQDAIALMREIDQAGAQAQERLMSTAVASRGDDVGARELTQTEANEMLAPTQRKLAVLKQRHPVLAFVARTDKQVFWHPKNPLRQLLQQSPGKGPYQLEVHPYTVESREGASQIVRRWPLRVVRFQVGSLDTGWRILPASDWNGD